MKYILLAFCLMGLAAQSSGRAGNKYEVIAYYTGDAANLRKYPLDKITQIIFSFLHLKDDTLSFRNPARQQRLRDITAMKKEFPHLKVLVSLGGWGGCAQCSPVFSKPESRKNFAASVVRILKEYNADGIDLDWEYPTISGYPGHAYAPEDKQNFTELIKELRKQMGKKYELSFAAGGFQRFLDESVDWKAIMPYLNRVNLMTYDLVGGFSTQTGHHTPLYSRPEQKNSTDNCVQWLLNHGVPASKMAIGVAFYARTWVEVAPDKNGLYNSGKFKSFVNYNTFSKRLSTDSGYVKHWDNVAKAPFMYNAEKQEFATFDDARSLAEKVAYMKRFKLGGIMFWELGCDLPQGGLLDAIDASIRSKVVAEAGEDK